MNLSERGLKSWQRGAFKRGKQDNGPDSSNSKMVGVYDQEMSDLAVVLKRDTRSNPETGQLSLLIREMDFFIIHARAHIHKKRLGHFQFSHTGNVRVWFNQIKVYFRENSGVSFGELLTRLMGPVTLSQLTPGGRTLSSLQKGKLEGFRKEAMFFTMVRAREALGLVLGHCEVEKALAAIAKTETGRHNEEALREQLGIASHVPLHKVPLLVDHQVYLIRQYLASSQTNVVSNKRRRIGASQNNAHDDDNNNNNNDSSSTGNHYSSGTHRPHPHHPGPPSSRRNRRLAARTVPDAPPGARFHTQRQRPDGPFPKRSVPL